MIFEYSNIGIVKYSDTQIFFYSEYSNIRVLEYSNKLYIPTISKLDYLNT